MNIDEIRKNKPDGATHYWIEVWVCDELKEFIGGECE